VIKVVKVIQYPIVEKEKETQKWFYSLSLSGCVKLKTQGLGLIFKHYRGYSTFLSNF